MTKTEHYLRYAAHCVGLADKAETVEQRVALLEMAQAWKKLAGQVEGITDLVDAARDMGIIPMKSQMS
jgi:hypothetical protein